MTKNKNKPYAVVFSYSFDPDTAVELFHTWDEALKFLVDSYNVELRIDREENDKNPKCSLDTESGYAFISNAWEDNDGEWHIDMTEFRIGNVYE